MKLQVLALACGPLIQINAGWLSLSQVLTADVLL
jgi:hypothetical protein